MAHTAVLTMQPRQQAGGGAFPLTLAGTGSRVRVTKIGGGHEARHFLEGLGFVEGACVQVVSQAGGNLIAEVKGARVALGQQMAARMMVAPE